MANNYDDIVKVAEQDIARIKVSLDEIHQSILKNSKAFRDMFQASGASPKDVNDLLKQNNALLKENAELKAKLIKEDSELVSKTKELDAITAKQKVNTQAVNKEMKIQATAASKVVGAYANLIAKQKQAKKTLQDLIVKQGKNTKATISAQRAYDRLTKKVNQAKKAVSNFSNSGLGSAVKGFRNLLGAFGLVGAISLITKLTKEIFKLAKEFDSLNFAMQSVLKTEIELASTQTFLLRLTEDFGVELVATTKRYIKFLAAAQQSNVSMADTEKIFRSVTKASAVLGLSTEELTGVYLALEQMLSKGKVTTEELRRQLGERLPGAMGIMAAALDVTIPKLDEMLKKGEVLSAEALPKFADALELAFGIQQVERVNTLVAAQNRLSNSWKLWIKDITEGDSALSNLFEGFLNGLEDVIQKISSLTMSENLKLQNAVIESEKEFEVVFNKAVEDRMRKQGIIVKDFTQEIYKTRSDIVLAKNKEEQKLAEDHLRVLIQQQIAQNEVVKQTGKEVSAEQIELAVNNYESLKKLYNKDRDDLENILKEKELAWDTYNNANLKENEKLFGKRGARQKIREAEQLLFRSDLDERIKAIRENLQQSGSDYAEWTAKFNILSRQLQESEVLQLEETEKKKRKLRDKTQKDVTLELLKIGADLNAKLVSDDQKSFQERISLLEDLSERRRLINERILQNDIESAKKAKEAVLGNDKATSEQKQKAIEHEQEMLKLASANYLKRLESDLDKERKLRKGIQDDVLKDVQDNLEELSKAQESQRNKEIEEANGDKKKIEEINKRHAETLLRIQSSYISEVLKNTGELSEEQIKILTGLLTKFGKEIDKFAEKTKNNLKETQEAFKDIFGSVFDTFGNAFDFDTSKFDFIFDELAKDFDKLDSTFSDVFNPKLIGDWADAAKELIGSVLSANLQRFDNQINAARIARDTILNEEGATEEQKEAARRKFEEKERKIKTERAKQERENQLIQIGVDTAVGVAKAVASYLSNPTTAPALPLVLPLIIGAGAAQAAFVASQPLPKFEQGTMNAPEGWAWTQEKQAEPIISKSGMLKTMGSSGGAQLTYLEKGDKVYKTQDELLSSLTAENIQNVVYGLNAYSNGESLNNNVLDKTLQKGFLGLKQSNEKVWGQVKKLAKRPTKIENVLTIEDKKAY